jgi:hypothetical protein
MSVPRHHVFYGEASSFTGLVDGGSPQPIQEQAFARLSPYGGSVSSPHVPFHHPGLVSIGTSFTVVTGAANSTGWSTSVKAVVQTLDIFNGAITADQITAEVKTQYPLVGYVPSISFQGTQFVNLKVNGKLATPTLNLNMCSPQPAGDAPYVSDPGLLGRAQAEYNAIATSGAPGSITGQFVWNPAVVQRKGKVDCSLVTGVVGLPVSEAFGHVLVLAGVGNVYLAELSVANHIEVTMLRVELTCQGKTELRAANLDSQGHTMP